MTAVRVLVVEDEYAVARDLELRLRLLGYACAGRADSGQGAIEAAERLRPDVVLMDIQLIGEMDGVDAAIEIRRRRDVPVIFLTAYGDPTTIERAKTAEPYGYALKPFDDRELRIVLEMALAKHEVDRRLKRANARLEALWSISELAGAAAETINTHVLRALREMTGSPLSFLAEIDAESGKARLWTSSEAGEGWRETAAEGGVIGMVAERAATVMDNSPERYRLTEDGPVLERVLAMPGIVNGHGATVAGVANRDGDYTQNDVTQILSFRDGVQALMDRERAEEELRRQVDFSQRIFNSTDAHLAVVGPDGRILEVNEAWRRFAAENEAGGVESWGPGASYCRACGPAEPDAVTAEQAYLGLVAVQRGGRAVFEMEYPCHSPEEQRWFSMRVLPLQGQPGTVLVSHTNVTARKMAEATLQESEEKYRRLFETMAQGVVYQAADGRIVSANPAAERILGLPLSQIEGKSSFYEGWETVREDGTELPGSEHPAMVALREGRVVEQFVMGIRNQGRGDRIWISVTAVPLFEAGAERAHQVYATFEDITAQRRAEHDYRTLFREMMHGCALHEILRDESGKAVDYLILAVNPAFERMTETKAEAMLGRRATEALPEMAQTCVEILGRVASSGEAVCYEKKIESLGKHLEVRSFRPRAGQVACVCADITARKKAEEERERLTAQLMQAQKMESIGRLAGGVAHDFNNLLTVINGHSQLALGGLEPGDRLYGSLTEIRKAGERAAVLTRQLLAFSRKQVMQPRVLKLNDVVEGVRTMLERLVGEDVEVRLRLDAGSPTVNADPHQLEQVLMNLVVNARDAMPKGGELRIETGVLECGCGGGPIEGGPAGMCGVLTVRDTGVGMDEETLRRAFEPFFTTKGTGKGTGLGLSMVQGIVEQSGGSIEVSSEPGRGTTFRIHLPLLTGRKAEAERPAAAGAKGGGGTILVVEDQQDVRNFVAAVLDVYGYRVIPAASAVEAIKICEKETGHIDLVLTDVVMPHTSGRELMSKLEEKWPGIKSLFMSGYSDDVIAHHGMLDKGVHFVQKPFGPEELSRKVQEVLGGG